MRVDQKVRCLSKKIYLKTSRENQKMRCFFKTMRFLTLHCSTFCHNCISVWIWVTASPNLLTRPRSVVLLLFSSSEGIFEVKKLEDLSWRIKVQGFLKLQQRWTKCIQRKPIMFQRSNNTYRNYFHVFSFSSNKFSLKGRELFGQPSYVAKSVRVM